MQPGQPGPARVHAARDGGGAVGAQDDLRGLDLNLEPELAGRQAVRLLQPLAQDDHGGDLVGRGDLGQGDHQAGRQRPPAGGQLPEEDVQRRDGPAAGSGLQALAAQPGKRRRYSGRHRPGQGASRRLRVAVLGRTAIAVAVLEVQPQVLDGLGSQLGGDPVANGPGQARRQAQDVSEVGPAGQVLRERGLRRAAPASRQARLELVGRHVHGMHRLAAGPVAGILAAQLRVRPGQQHVQLGPGGVREPAGCGGLTRPARLTRPVRPMHPVRSRCPVRLVRPAGFRRRGHPVSAMCSGRIGIRFSSRPVAARIAAATAGPEEMVGASPTPRRP